MFKMLKLDWLGMKCYRTRIIILPVIISVYGLFSEALIIPFVTFMLFSFSVNPFAVEEKGKLDNLYLTLPITRKTIVNTRFCLSLIMQLTGILFGTVVTVIMSAILHGKTVFYTHTFTADYKTILLLISASLLFYSVINLATFPTLFKIGYAKGKAIGFYMPVAVVTVIIFIVYFLWYLNENFQRWLTKIVDWAYNNPLYISGILFVSAAFILSASYALSLLFYSKREL